MNLCIDSFFLQQKMYQLSINPLLSKIPQSTLVNKSTLYSSAHLLFTLLDNPETLSSTNASVEHKSIVTRFVSTSKCNVVSVFVLDLFITSVTLSSTIASIETDTVFTTFVLTFTCKIVSVFVSDVPVDFKF